MKGVVEILPKQCYTGFMITEGEVAAMNTEYLKEFITIARLASFSRAAEELCISQSSLSKHIAALEQELNIRLLHRTSRCVELSEVGKRLLPYAARITEMSQQIQTIAYKQAIWDAHKKRCRKVCIASFPLMAAYNITGVIADFYRSHPDIAVSPSEFEPFSIPHLLETNRFELAFVRPFRSGMSEYESIEYCSEDVIAILPAVHPLASESVIRLEQLKEESLILIGEQAELRSICVDLCIQAGFSPQISFSGLRPENIIDLVSLNMGVSLLARHFYDYYKKPMVVGVEITPTARTAIHLIRRKGHRLSPEAQAFWDYIQNHKCGTLQKTVFP